MNTLRGNAYFSIKSGVVVTKLDGIRKAKSIHYRLYAHSYGRYTVFFKNSVGMGRIPPFTLHYIPVCKLLFLD